MNANPQPRFCRSCGAPIHPGQRFCEACGKELPQAAATPQAQPAQPEVTPGAAQHATAPSPRAATPQPAQQVPSPQPVPPQPHHAGPAPTPRPQPAQYPARSPQVYPPQGVAPYSPPPRKRSRGCWACLLIPAVLLGLAVLCLAGVFIYRSIPRDSSKMTFGAREDLPAQTVSSGGGTLDLHPAQSGLSSLSIAVPDGAYPQDTRFQVSLQPIVSHQFGENFTPITPLVTITDSGGFAAIPMQVTIPIQLAPDEFAMGFYYDRIKGALEGIPLVDENQSSITLAASHFSSIVISKAKTDYLESISVDSDFRPGVDDWQMANNGSYASPGGACAGMSISAMWYYEERALKAGEPRLNGHFDNNLNNPKTPGFQFDDDWAIRFTSSVQRSIDWDSYTFTISRILGGVNDRLTYLAFLYTMDETHAPQFVGIARYYTDAQGKPRRGGHAIVAYKIEGGKIYVADPNKPGMPDRTVNFDGAAFSPYSSGANAKDIQEQGAVAYTDIRYLGTTAMIAWDKIGSLYDDLTKGKAGEGLFMKIGYQYQDVVDANGTPIFKPLPDILKIDEAWTARNGEDLRGKLAILVSNPMPYPRAVDNLYLALYNGATLYGDTTYPAGGKQLITTVLQPGVNNLGVYTASAEGNRQNFNDFRRVKVIYGDLDLSGAWEGNMTVQEAAGAQGFVREQLIKVLLSTGVAKNQSEAESLADAMIVPNPNLAAPRPMAVVFTPSGAAGHYTLTANTRADDGSTEQSTGTADVVDGRVTLHFRHADGTTFTFTGDLLGKTQMSGSFTGSAWGVVPNAVSGLFDLGKTK